MSKLLGDLVIAVSIFICVSFILAYPFMLFWNFVVVDALSVANQIGFWQALYVSMFLLMFLANTTTK